MSLHPDSSPRNSHRDTDGFTLVEVLVALTLLTTALVPAFVLASNAVNLSTQIKNSLIGSNLAQEGVEIVLAIRDANWLADSPAPMADHGLSDCAIACWAQWDSSDMDSTSGDRPLKVDSTGLYQYSGSGTDSIFHRTITITPDATGIKVVVVSEVTWAERGRPKSSKVEYHLYNWLP